MNLLSALDKIMVKWYNEDRNRGGIKVPIPESNGVKSAGWGRACYLAFILPASDLKKG
nr:MAG TPA: hypothetical protein [Caudoviricetes sp.]